MTTQREGPTHSATDSTRPDIVRVSSEEIYRNAWLSVRHDRIRRSDGSDGSYGVIDRPLGVVVIPRRTDGDSEEFFLVEQYRYPLGARRWEFPAGTAPDGDDDPIRVARQELLEETGLAAGELTVLSVMDVAPGFTSQRSAVVLAEKLTAGEHRREHEEQDLRGRWWSVDDVVDAIGTGRLVDAQSLAAWACLTSRR